MKTQIIKKNTKIAIYTLGCRANQADSDALLLKLVQNGFQIAGKNERPDVQIINTCTVTGKASYQSRQAVRRAIKLNPDAMNIVTGCDVEIERKVLESINGVDFVVGVDNIMNIVDILNGSKRQEAGGKNDVEDNPVSGFLLPASIKRSRPFIKIQDGCENNCSYCIVPRARGKYRSQEPEAVIDAIKQFCKQGFYEVVLTGIHIGKYGADFAVPAKKGVQIGSCFRRDDMELSLTTLIRGILYETEIGRIRLSSIEPDEVTDDLIKLIESSSGRICHHLHIPMQSGSDTVLQRMNRGYNAAQYKAVLEKVAGTVLDIAIGLDVITGFPGETEEEFEETYNFIKLLPVSYLHVFSYSDRSGTDASQMKNKIREIVKKERTKLLRELSVMKRESYLKKYIGKNKLVVFDSAKNIGYRTGVADNFIKVKVDSKTDVRHADILLTRIEGETMRGELI